MEALISRYRNVSVLVSLILAQLILLAYQVKTDGDVRLVRVWVVTAMTPMARLLEGTRSNTKTALSGWGDMRVVREENLQLKDEIGKLKVREQFLENQLHEASHAKALQIFQQQTTSKTLAARIIGTATGIKSGGFYLDRGTNDGVERGMAVIVPDGIVGKIVASYPKASLMMLITEQSFVASVISQKTRVRGMLKAGKNSTLVVDNLSNLQKVEDGEWFFTSGEDRIFPKGFRAGVCKLIRDGKFTRTVELTPSGLQDDLESVLIVAGGVHSLIPAPDMPPSTEVSLLPAPPPEGAAATEIAAPDGSNLKTEADRIVQKYRRIGEAQNHQYGTTVGRAPDFNRAAPAAVPPAAPTAKLPETPKKQ